MFFDDRRRRLDGGCAVADDDVVRLSDCDQILDDCVLLRYLWNPPSL